MDKQKPLIELCPVCGFEMEYVDYHRLYVACKNCTSIRCAKLYQNKKKKF